MKIISIQLEKYSYILGGKGVTQIKEIEVNGEMAKVPWFRVWLDNEQIKEINGKYVVEVCYEN